MQIEPYAAVVSTENILASITASDCRRTLGWPYVSPGSNDANGIDCSGLFVKAFRDQGASIYHGSNTIYRKYCSEKGELTSVSQLCPGMAVFKWNSNTPSKFNDGLGDFQHIGLVTGTNPLRIVHASSAAGCVTADTKLGKWAYWGWLKDVEKDADIPSSDASTTTEGDDGTVSTPKTATVTAPTGSTVNMRAKPKAGAALVERVPIDSKVILLSEGDVWSKIKYGQWTGYMMSTFLIPEDAETETNPLDAATLEQRVANLEQRVAALENGGVGGG